MWYHHTPRYYNNNLQCRWSLGIRLSKTQLLSSYVFLYYMPARSVITRRIVLATEDSKSGMQTDPASWRSSTDNVICVKTTAPQVATTTTQTTSQTASATILSSGQSSSIATHSSTLLPVPTTSVPGKTKMSDSVTYLYVHMVNSNSGTVYTSVTPTPSSIVTKSGRASFCHTSILLVVFLQTSIFVLHGLI